jgi:hypothetical protein
LESRSSHADRRLSLAASTSPISVERTGLNPTNDKMFLRKLFRPCAAKYQRYTAAGIPIVTTTRADLPRKRGVHP